jgi:hypothetical protein
VAAAVVVAGAVVGTVTSAFAAVLRPFVATGAAAATAGAASVVFDFLAGMFVLVADLAAGISNAGYTRYTRDLFKSQLGEDKIIFETITIDTAHS